MGEADLKGINFEALYSYAKGSEPNRRIKTLPEGYREWIDQESEEGHQEVVPIRIHDLDLSVRVFNRLFGLGIRTVDDLKELLKAGYLPSGIGRAGIY